MVAADPLMEKGIIGLGAAGLALRDLVGAPVGSLRARFFSLGRSLFERVVEENSEEATIKVIIGNEISYGHRLPAGRIAGKLIASKLGLYALDLGIGLGVDVGFQAWMDYGNPYLTREQFGYRLGVAGAGSVVSFGAGTLAGSLSGLSTVGILGGPAGWVAIGVGISVAILWDVWIAPTIYNNFGLNSERNLAPLRP